MFTKPLTRAPRYILFKSFFLAIGRSYLHDLSQTVLKRLKLLWGEIAWSKALRFLQITAKNQDFLFFYRIFNDKKFIPKYLDNAVTDFALTLRNIEATVFEKKAPVNDFSIFRFLDCFVKNWATCGNIVQIPAPPPPPLARNCPYACDYINLKVDLPMLCTLSCSSIQFSRAEKFALA